MLCVENLYVELNIYVTLGYYPLGEVAFAQKLIFTTLHQHILVGICKFEYVDNVPFLCMQCG